MQSFFVLKIATLEILLCSFLLYVTFSAETGSSNWGSGSGQCSQGPKPKPYSINLCEVQGSKKHTCYTKGCASYVGPNNPKPEALYPKPCNKHPNPQTRPVLRVGLALLGPGSAIGLEFQEAQWRFSGALLRRVLRFRA